MRKLVIRSIETVTTIAFFLIVAWFTLAGFYAFKSAGLLAVVGALGGLCIGFVVAVIATGVIYLLISINDHLDRIRRDAGPAA